MSFIQKPLEIPYNFDTKLIDFLNIYKFTMHCIYLPPLGLDYPFSAKYNTLRIAKNLIDIHFPETREEYEYHINYIKKSFSNKMMLLLQSNIKVMKEEMLQYYINLGFTKFCVGTIEQAKLIRQLIPEAEIIGSITMKIEPEILQNNLNEYKANFDGFVLWFPFNRDLNKVWQLPKCFKYSLLVNCFCMTCCDGTRHWFIREEQENNLFFCPHKIHSESDKYKDIIFIRPDHLELFDKYITYFKLQGREHATQEIIQDIILYTTKLEQYHFFENIDINNTFNFPKAKYYPTNFCH